MKTIKKYYKIFAIIIPFLLMSYNLNCMANDEPYDLYSISAVLLDGESGRVLLEKNGYEIRPMASTTKIMTLILALEYGDDEDIVTVSSYASKMPDVQLGIMEGEQYNLKDLYYSLILESHNDVAVAIAEHIGGNVKSFSDMMNNKAKELGLNNTYFITPNGLDSCDEKGTHSTNAVELALLMKYCVMDSPKRDEFINICQTKEYSFSEYNNSRSFVVKNKNELLNSIDGMLSGKTGFTADAGYCYVAAVNKDDKTYIIALLGCGWPNNKRYKWIDAKKLFDYGFNSFTYKEIVSQDIKINSIYIPNGTPNNYIETGIDEYIALLLRDEDKVKIKYRLPAFINPPVEKGDVVGYMDVFINGVLYKTINVYAEESSYIKDFEYYYSLIIDIFL